MPSGRQIHSHRSPARSRGPAGTFTSVCVRVARQLADLADDFLERRYLVAGDDERLTRDAGRLGGEPERCDQIVDVDHVVARAAIAEQDHSLAAGKLIELDQPGVAGAVDGCRSDRHDLHPVAGIAQRQLVAFRLGDLVDPVRSDRRRLARRWADDVAVDADRAAVDHAAHAMAPRRLHHQADRLDVDLTIAVVGQVGLAEGAGDAVDGVDSGHGPIDRLGIGDVALAQLDLGQPRGRRPPPGGAPGPLPAGRKRAGTRSAPCQ